jgi:hypothetical protein
MVCFCVLVKLVYLTNVFDQIHVIGYIALNMKSQDQFLDKIFEKKAIDRRHLY